MSAAAPQRSSTARPWLRYALLAAVVLAFAALWVTVGDPLGALLSLIVLALAAALLGAVAAYFITNAPYWLRSLRGISWEEHLERLEADGKAVREQYRTRRALTFEDLTTSGLVHLIEIGDGRLLCLYGQHYYDFEPIDDDPEINQERRFPTSEFSLLRDRRNGKPLALIPGKEVVAPTLCEAIAKHKAIFALGIRLEDGELISSVSFESAHQAIQADAAPARKGRRASPQP